MSSGNSCVYTFKSVTFGIFRAFTALTAADDVKEEDDDDDDDPEENERFPIPEGGLKEETDDTPMKTELNSHVKGKIRKLKNVPFKHFPSQELY